MRGSFTPQAIQEHPGEEKVAVHTIPSCAKRECKTAAKSYLVEVK